MSLGKITAAALALVSAELLVSRGFVSYAVKRKNPRSQSAAPNPAEHCTPEMKAVIDDQAEKTKAWLGSAKVKHLCMTAFDGIKLRSDMIITDESSPLWAVLVHGYSADRSAMYDFGRYYAEKGFNLLIPDDRAHGKSEGEYIGMGCLDRLDVIRWAEHIVSVYPESKIILHGVSMGGATVMMTSGEKLPDNIKAIVDDCGYTSVRDIFTSVLKNSYHLPSFPLIDTSELMVKQLAGYGFDEAAAIDQVKKTKLPMMFIHGDSDDFVPTEMVYRLYDACPNNKELYIAKKAGHAQAIYADPDLYFEKVFGFLHEQGII